MKPIEEMTIAEAKADMDATRARLAELSELFNQPTISQQAPENEGGLLVGERVIIRCRNAGVHFGTLVSVSGQTVTLKNARRIWRYWAGNGETTLSGVARHGMADRSEPRVAGSVDTIILTEACEIISMSIEAANNLENYRVAQAD